MMVECDLLSLLRLWKLHPQMSVVEGVSEGHDTKSVYKYAIAVYP